MLERVRFEAADGFSSCVFVIFVSRNVDLNHFIYIIKVAGKVAFILFVLFDEAMDAWPVDRLVKS